jgi:hypothetical protein
MKRYKVIVVGKAFITQLTTSLDGVTVIDVDNSALIDIECWNLEVEAETEQEAGVAAAQLATTQAYDTRGGGPLWACLPIAAMEIHDDEA